MALKSDPSRRIKPPDKSMLLWETPFGMLVPPIYMILRLWSMGIHKFRFPHFHASPGLTNPKRLFKWEATIEVSKIIVNYKYQITSD